MPEPAALITEPHPGVVTVTLDRDEKLNSVTPEMTAACWQALTALGDRDDLRCMVLTARGRYFSAGIDLTHGAGSRKGDPGVPGPQPGWSYRRNYRSHHLLYDEMEAVEKPIIVAAQGPLLGWGVETAVAADFRFCSPRATWRLPETRLGAIAGSGGTSRLTRLIGPHWAKWLAMAGEAITADEAMRIGLVHRVVPEDRLMDEVYAFCLRLIELPAEAVGVAKVAVDLAADVGDRGAQRQIDRLANTTLRVGPYAATPDLDSRSKQ